MNYHLFSAFLLITLVITTGATRGIRAALMTVLRSTLGNAVLITCIALGVNWILRTSAEVFESVGNKQCGIGGQPIPTIRLLSVDDHSIQLHLPPVVEAVAGE
jgi:hypothetical protein